MIAEWFYWLTSEIGRCFNNSTLMREHTYEEDIITGTFMLWFMLFLLFVICLCLFAILIIRQKEYDRR